MAAGGPVSGAQASGDVALNLLPAPPPGQAIQIRSAAQLPAAPQVTNLDWGFQMPFTNAYSSADSRQKGDTCATEPSISKECSSLHHDPLPQALRLREPHPAEKLAKYSVYFWGPWFKAAFREAMKWLRLRSSI